jgi:cobalt-zinc-cadmium efflux system outer membrane protein
MHTQLASTQSEIVLTPTADDGPGERLTLETMVQIALANNPTLRQASASLEAARGKWVQVGLYPNPGLGYLGNQIGDRGTAGQQGAYLEQEFVRGGKLTLNRQVAEREIAIAQQTLEAQRQRVINDVRTQFYNTLVAQRSVEITRELREIGVRGQSVADQLFDAKQVGRDSSPHRSGQCQSQGFGCGKSSGGHLAAVGHGLRRAGNAIAEARG